MKLFIPTVNSELVLKNPVKVSVYYEFRNKSFLEKLGIIFESPKWSEKIKGSDPVLLSKYGVTLSKGFAEFKLPKGYVLKVSRIYIRNGAEEFDSLTFNGKGTGFPSGRFWLKLADVNKMEIEDPEDIEDVNKKKSEVFEKNQTKKEEKLLRDFNKACDDLKSSQYTWEDVAEYYHTCLPHLDTIKRYAKLGVFSYDQLKLSAEYIDRFLVQKRR